MTEPTSGEILNELDRYCREKIIMIDCENVTYRGCDLASKLWLHLKNWIEQQTKNKEHQSDE